MNSEITFPTIEKERMVIESGGLFDKTRCYAPSVLKHGDEYLMYYTGSNDNPSSRSGYRLLLARSKDGISFEKTNTPVLDMFPLAKCYSAEAYIQDCGCIGLYFALNDGSGYKIFRSSTDDPQGPLSEPKLTVDTSPLFSHSVHTLRVIKSDCIYHGYVTASSNGARNQSKKYKHYRVSSDFRIFHATSEDGEKFGAFKEITLPQHSFINIYGHSVFIRDGIVYLIFTGFNGEAGCTLHMCGSHDFENFSEPRELFKPDEKIGEIGMYSTCVIPLDHDRWRLFYASRAAWKYRGIASALMRF